MKLSALTSTLVAAAVAGTFAVPSLAQTKPVPRSAMERSERSSTFGAYAYAPQGAYGYAQQRSVVAPDGAPIPGYVLSTPDKCWTNGGYGRWDTCESGGN
jgi:hypothetical protein